MLALLYLIPITLALGGPGLALFIWSVRSGQYEDMDAAAWRILEDDVPPGPRRSRDEGQS